MAIYAPSSLLRHQKNTVDHVILNNNVAKLVTSPLSLFPFLVIYYLNCPLPYTDTKAMQERDCNRSKLYYRGARKLKTSSVSTSLFIVVYIISNGFER